MSEKEQRIVFSHNLNQFISKSNKSQKEIADAIGVSPQTFNTWCRGKAIPRMGKIQTLANYFCVNKSELIDTISTDFGKNTQNAKRNKEIMAENIKYYLNKNNLSATDICNTLGFKPSTFSDWIHARTYPRIDKIELMANYFGIGKADLVEKHGGTSYYLDPETAKVAQEIKDNKELSLLFDAARDAKPDDLKTVHTMLLALKRKEQGYDE